MTAEPKSINLTCDRPRQSIDVAKKRITKTHLVICVNDNILILQISLHNPQLPQCVYDLDDLSKNVTSNLFGESNMLFDAFEEITGRSSLHRYRFRRFRSERLLGLDEDSGGESWEVGGRGDA